MSTEHWIETPTHGHYLLDIDKSDSELLLVGFHGYGENAEKQLERLRAANVPDAALCSIQGLHCFYRGQDIAASWMTSQHREQCIANNILYIDRVLDAIEAACSWQRLIFVGYSQGAAMAYRAAINGRHACTALFINGGDIPPDVLPQLLNVPPLCIVRGEDDDAYDTDALKRDRQRLGALPHQVHTFPGSHSWTEASSMQLGLFISSLDQ